MTTCGLLTIEVVKELVCTDPPQAIYSTLTPEQLRGRGTSPALTLLKLFVSRPERFALRDWLREQFCQDQELFSSVRLDNIVSLLRGLLCPEAYRDLRTHLVAHVRGSASSGDGYQLASYPLIWIDYEALVWNVEQAARMERFGDDPLPYWQRAYQLARRGIYLPDEIYSDWAAARRAEVAGMRRQSVQALARLYLAQQGEAGEEEALLLRSSWQEDPREEDMLRPLMELLGRRERYQEALEYYRRLETLLEEEGAESDARTRDLADYLRTKQRAPLQREQRLARTQPGTDTPPSMDVFAEQSGSSDLLQAFLDGEMSMFDPEKRKTLETLFMTVGLTLLKPQAVFQPEFLRQFFSPETATPKITDETIEGYTKLLEACWQLSRGNELALAEKLLPECMSRLVPLAQQASPHQQSAARLAAQGYDLYSIFALHKDNLAASERYSKQAVQYSALSEDQALQVVSMRSLGSKYLYQSKYLQALQIYFDALQHAESVSPLLQSLIYMKLARGYASLDQTQEALNYLGLALDAFPEHPKTDPSFSFAEFDLPWLILDEGVIRTRLSQAHQALAVFERIEQPEIATPERIRLEIVNQQAKTALGSGDLEQGFAYVLAGATGAQTLGSPRRMREAYENYQQMTLLWPQEKRVKHLRELFPSQTASH